MSAKAHLPMVRSFGALRVPALATEEFIIELASLVSKRAEPQMCDPYSGIQESSGQMQWYEALDLPLPAGESAGSKSLKLPS